MKIYSFSKRCAKEIIRDPVNLGFGLGFPIALLLLFRAMQSNIPVELFEIGTLSPGMAVFALSFVTLFSATLIARDRETAFIERLFTAPMRSVDFILGYTLPLVVISILQSIVCYAFSVVLGLPVSANILLAVLLMIPISVFYISVGLFFGSILNVKQVGGICGALFTNLSAWLSGVWFDISLVGAVFERIARLLPFIHAVELERAAISGNFSGILPHLYPVIIYGALMTALGSLAFLKQMKK